jgi:hypothetical protein
MSVDKRELILSRLLTILETVDITGVTIHRDRAEFEEAELPVVVLLDGSETAAVAAGQRGAGRAPQVMMMTPQVFYVPVPSENNRNEGIPAKLSEARIKIIKAILQDGPLADLQGSNGYIEYRGTVTDMQTGAEVTGQMQLEFALTYTFDPTRL